MSYKSIDLFNGEILIQRGVRKKYHNIDKMDEFVTEYPLDIRERDNYCIDIRGVDSFYQVYFDDVCGYRLYQYRTGYYDRYYELNNISLEEINKGYIKLSDFLSDAVYVGREFRRTLPVITYYGTDKDEYKMKDNGYLDGDYSDKNIVLYMKDNIFLVKTISRFGEIYKIIGCNYIFDGNYEFYGDIYEEYRDRNKIYLEIVRQIDGYNKRNVKIRTKSR